MAYSYRLIPLAQEEYEFSIKWYLQRSVKAASNFVKTIDGRISNICNNPEIHRNEYKNYYECKVFRFPFTIIYAIEKEEQLIIIIAIYHQKREPRNKYR